MTKAELLKELKSGGDLRVYDGGWKLHKPREKRGHKYYTVPAIPVNSEMVEELIHQEILSFAGHIAWLK